MAKKTIGQKLQKVYKKKGPITKNRINKLADKFDLSFAGVLGKAQDMEGVKLEDMLANELKANPYKYGTPRGSKDFRDYIAGSESLDGIYDHAGIDKDRLYKGAEQDKATQAVRDEMGDLKIAQLSDEELFQRMEVPQKTQNQINEYDKKYRYRFSENGELKFDANGNPLRINQPKYQSLFKIGDNQRAKAKINNSIDQFKMSGGFKAKNMTSDSIKKTKKKGQSILGGMGL